MNFPPTYYRTTTKPVTFTKHAISKRLVFCSLNSTLPEIVNRSGMTNLQYRFSMLSKWVNGRCKRCTMYLNLNENSILQACLKPEMCWGSLCFMGTRVEHACCANCGPFPIIYRSWKSTFSFFFKKLYSVSEHQFNPSLFQWTKCRFCDWICKSSSENLQSSLPIFFTPHEIMIMF